MELNADQEDVCWQAEWASLVGMLAVENAVVLVEKALQEQKMQPATETIVKHDTHACSRKLWVHT